MSSIRNIVLCGFSACLTLWSAQASAQTIASFSIPVHGVALGGDTNLSVAGPSLGATSTSFMAFNFVLPRDYVNNTEVMVLLSLSSFSPGCGIHFTATQMVRSRTGGPPVNSLDGLTAPNPVISPTSSNVFLKAFKINPGGVFTDQRKGDAIAFQFSRDPAHASDTCGGALQIDGIDVRYTAN